MQCNRVPPAAAPSYLQKKTQYNHVLRSAFLSSAEVVKRWLAVPAGGAWGAAPTSHCRERQTEWRIRCPCVELKWGGRRLGSQGGTGQSPSSGGPCCCAQCSVTGRWPPCLLCILRRSCQAVQTCVGEPGGRCRYLAAPSLTVERRPLVLPCVITFHCAASSGRRRPVPRRPSPGPGGRGKPPPPGALPVKRQN